MTAFSTRRSTRMLQLLRAAKGQTRNSRRPSQSTSASPLKAVQLNAQPQGPRSARFRSVWQAAGEAHLNSVAYLRAISATCSLVNGFGGTPGELQVSRKKPSRPAGVTIQSRSSS
jgi:hypothetical protein